MKGYNETPKRSLVFLHELHAREDIRSCDGSLKSRQCLNHLEGLDEPLILLCKVRKGYLGQGLPVQSALEACEDSLYLFIIFTLSLKPVLWAHVSRLCIFHKCIQPYRVLICARKK